MAVSFTGFADKRSGRLEMACLFIHTGSAGDTVIQDMGNITGRRHNRNSTFKKIPHPDTQAATAAAIADHGKTVPKILFEPGGMDETFVVTIFKDFDSLLLGSFPKFLILVP